MSVGYNGSTEFSQLGNVDRMSNAPAWTTTLGLYINALTGAAAVVSRSAAGSAPFQFEIQMTASAQILILFDNAGSFGTATTTPVLNAVTPYHVGVVFDGRGVTNDDKWKVYIDGVSAGALTFGSAAPTTALASLTGQPVHVGIRGGGTIGLNGFVQDIRMWDVALTPQEIANDRLVLVPGRPESLRLWAPFTTKTDTRTFVPLDADVVHTTATADGGELFPARTIGQYGSQAPKPSRRGRTLRSFTQDRVRSFPGFQRGM
jgi:hypothetical protein